MDRNFILFFSRLIFLFYHTGLVAQLVGKIVKTIVAYLRKIIQPFSNFRDCLKISFLPFFMKSDQILKYMGVCIFIIHEQHPAIRSKNF